jgi:putative hemolysin
MDLTEGRAAKPVDVQAGSLRIRLAESNEEVDACLALRYRVFCDEMGVKPTAEMAAKEREFDSYDAYCDHLMVLDETRGQGLDSVVGTYRLMRRDLADRCGQFYSADEFDISSLIDYEGGILEVGRSCVDRDSRTGSTMQLLWRGIAAYIFHYRIDILFGCASLPGVEPSRLMMPLSYLYHHHLAPVSLRARAQPERYVPMNILGPEEISNRDALRALPPLIKGYLRLGGFVGDGAVVDKEFGTTDVCIVVKTDRITEKYYRHYSRDEEAKNGDEA